MARPSDRSSQTGWRRARAAAWLGGLAAFAALPVGADQIEVIRGGKSTTHEVGNGEGRTRSSHGVEVMIGIEPGSRTVDFETKRYELSSHERSSIRRRVNRMIGLYRSELGVRVPAGFQVDLAIHGEGRAYDQRAGALRRAAGFYDPVSRKAVVSGRDQSETHETALHESSHAVLMQSVETVPAFLNEGLAEYFETLELGASKAHVPIDSRRAGYLMRYLERGGGWPVSELIEMPHPSWRGLPEEASYVAYTQSWALVSFMMETDANRSRLHKVLDSVRRGVAATDAFERHYRGGVEALERDWLAWLPGAGGTHRY